MPLTDFRIFIPAAAFLAAVLLVWAQLWLRTYGAVERAVVNVAIGLFWTFFAVLLALLALAWAVFQSLSTQQGSVPNIAVGLFIASLVMAGLNVGQSLFSVSLKLWKRWPLFEPISLPRWLFWFVVGLAFALSGASIGAVYRRWVGWVIMGTVAVAIIIVLSTVYLQYRKCSQQKLDY